MSSAVTRDSHQRHDNILPPRTHVRQALRLGNEGRGGGRLVLPDGRQLASALVVAGQAVDARLDENEAILGVLVLAVALKMLADRDGLLDEVVEILGDFRSETYRERERHAPTCMDTCQTQRQTKHTRIDSRRMESFS